MTERNYSASFARARVVPGSRIFRHPARRDAVDKPGVRVRRGLGTRDRVEAERLLAVGSCELLGNPRRTTLRRLAPMPHSWSTRETSRSSTTMIPARSTCAGPGTSHPASEPRARRLAVGFSWEDWSRQDYSCPPVDLERPGDRALPVYIDRPDHRHHRRRPRSRPWHAVVTFMSVTNFATVSERMHLCRRLADGAGTGVIRRRLLST